ncbi:protein sprouty [Cydia pomonella]|uniref:protein sprouty n=1 Tax=Cydia pomonella TaxID=82600 RepID=UPI002ADE2550|nr:protein sprouty [Cydia pomonella]XP_061706601.1 protein sprouty [Cydia pomonella]XP_061706602.1 protein sprouty [Cydia pomonella]XP_061706603.1 protein sprouty [Cydia pomonella]XP_061706604.1 protein sprouty [Cydia pomonella]XP_061706605.1 protein sprouty [Cydia pomonella]XP_061706606.1 protein sprouty [Cydia pomonella]XP_061706608.1 protein sprouty [Cydia pomonella]XP_061706609.1 protein sprouty [Cydia pomonella]XP_061706610.1 protein sprouty [Cydia pomonella]XP_061706611.1 protein sp
MDEYGGPAAPPRPPKPAARVHRPPPPGARPTVSLLRPRPETERERNAYVEAPRRAHAHAHAAHAAPHAAAQPLKPVTAQPAAVDKRRALAPDSIVCERCGRCRCEQCARPRPLPSRWLCGSCLCSAEACVDYASCMCCVKALFYHCGSGEDEAGSPCACGPRLACVGLLSLPLPCLWLYWPLRGLAAAGAAGYARCRRAGCRCPEPPARPPSSII